ncbi:MAG: patatin-like phospholipase family protein [Planctomycetes bacterium]|nr:patatin-like phospholipase family protein [Planctomycetota bacterium]
MARPRLSFSFPCLLALFGLLPGLTAAEVAQDANDLNGDGLVVGLALSGGGLRATGVAYGALMELSDLGFLERVDWISAVSGGSIIAAYYGLGLPLDSFGGKLQTNLATESLGNVFTPKNLFDGRDTTRTDGFAQTLDDLFFGGQRMTALRERPRLLINATNLETANLFVFSRAASGDESQDASGHLPLYELPAAEQSRIRVSACVAASSAIPTVLVPFELKVVPRGSNGDSTSKARVIRLIDGGVVDNQGIEALLTRRCDAILSVDASASVITEKGYRYFTPGSTKVIPIIRKRYRDLLQARVRDRLGERYVHLQVTDETVVEMSPLQTSLEKEELARLVAHGRDLVRGQREAIVGALASPESQR